MFANHVGEDIPHLSGFALNHFLRRLDRGGEAFRFELAKDERLEQFKRHLLRQPALVQPQRGPNHNYRSAGIVDTLAEQVLAETTLLAFDHVGQGLQRALVRTRDRAAATTVVEQRIDRFLQHAFFVTHDDVWCVQIQQPLQAVVAIDDAAIQIVQIRGGKAATVQRHQRAQIGRQYRQHRHDHPLRLVAGRNERFHQLQALRELLDLGLRVRCRNLFAQRVDLFVEVELKQQIAHGLGTHLRGELVAVLFQLLEILFVSEQLTQV